MFCQFPCHLQRRRRKEEGARGKHQGWTNQQETSSIHWAMSGSPWLDLHFLSVVTSKWLSHWKPRPHCHPKGGCGYGGSALRSFRKKELFAKMFPHSYSVCQTPNYTHTWVNTAVGVNWLKLSRPITEDEATHLRLSSESLPLLFSLILGWGWWSVVCTSWGMFVAFVSQTG